MSEDIMLDNIAWVKTQDPVVSFPVVISAKIVASDVVASARETIIERECCGCHAPLRMSATLINREVLDVACGHCRESVFTGLTHPMPEKVIVSRSPKSIDSAALSPTVKVKNCPHCNGERRGRGFTHNDIDGKPCPDSVKGKAASKVKSDAPVCPHCGGKKRGKGFTHLTMADGTVCPSSIKVVKPKVDKPEKVIAKCPHCGGLRRGRGYMHLMVDGQPCVDSVKVKAGKYKDYRRVNVRRRW